MGRFILRAWAAIACLLAVWLAGPAQAGSGLSVSPVSLIFGPDGRPQALEVANPGSDPTEVQVRLFAWRLEGGEDHLEPSADIGFSPPMFRLEPGARQIVRLAALSPAGAQERAYRLFVDQLPKAPKPGQLQMPVRMALPLFVGALSEASPPVLSWRVDFDAAAGRARVVATNPGRRRVKIMDLSYMDGGESRPIAGGLSGYVLAGATRTWAFDYRGPPQALALRLRAEGSELAVQAEPSGR